MLFDNRIYDPKTNQYTLESFIEQAKDVYGGYDILLLWHGYPRLGVDERSQFDIWRDLPGGLEELSRLITMCHNHHVRVVLPYNPWDIAAQSEDNESILKLVELIKQTNADGVFLDTLSASRPDLRELLDAVRPGLIIITEGVPSNDQIGLINSSWGQWLNIPPEPGILKLKWKYPGHQQYLIGRWNRDRGTEIATAFFNSAGIIVWDNVFGTMNPWNAYNQTLWKKSNLILHHFSDLLTCGQWTPFVDTLSPGLYANLWQNDNQQLYIFHSTNKSSTSLPLILIDDQNEYEYYDVWHGEKIQPVGKIITASIHQLGCIAAIRKKTETPEFIELIESLQKIQINTLPKESKVFLPSYKNNIYRTPSIPVENVPEGMVYVPSVPFDMHIRHIRRECGCYLDNHKDTIENFGYRLLFGAIYPDVIHKEIHHHIKSVSITAFFIDATEVTNAQFKVFLDATGYQPKHPENFLKHWTDGKMPPELADHPVVYVALDDAKAYAKWAGKRLPTEAEWQLAAQGTDGRIWPWGNVFDPQKCTMEESTTVTVRSFSTGRSPYGCYHMSGNVWEWTNTVYNDGWTRFTMIRGGSFYNAEGSVWYVQGGPQPCGHHAKFILTWPGLDRCSTVGFRCVKDVE